MYKQYSADRINSIENSMIPEEISKSMEEENAKIIEEERIMKEKLNSITLKFKVNEVEKNISTKKTTTAKELKLKVMQEYGIDLDEKNVRIRVVNPTGKFLESFPLENKTVDEYSIYAYRIYGLEIRENENVLFDDFDPNMINISVYFWQDRYQTMEESEFVSELIRINRQSPLLTLRDRIYEQFKIDRSKEIYCFKKLETITAELFTNSYDLNKEIYLNALYEGTKVYVEVRENPDSKSKFKSVITLLT
jgi:hypothetical protein